MAGRWAQLAIDAHIAKAIDYNRPIKRWMEAIIFDRMEMARNLMAANLYPTMTEDGHLIHRPDKWVDAVKEVQILPWRGVVPEITDPTPTMQERIAYLEEVQRGR